MSSVDATFHMEPDREAPAERDYGDLHVARGLAVVLAGSALIWAAAALIVWHTLQ
jgi:hypothetical protein